MWIAFKCKKCGKHDNAFLTHEDMINGVRDTLICEACAIAETFKRFVFVLPDDVYLSELIVECDPMSTDMRN